MFYLSLHFDFDFTWNCLHFDAPVSCVIAWQAPHLKSVDNVNVDDDGNVDVFGDDEEVDVFIQICVHIPQHI